MTVKELIFMLQQVKDQDQKVFCPGNGGKKWLEVERVMLYYNPEKPGEREDCINIMGVEKKDDIYLHRQHR